MAKIDKWLSRESLQQIETWAAQCTDRELADRMGITRSTLAKWKKDFSDISDSITRGRTDIHACAEVENTLLKRALGYTETIRKPIKIKHVKYGPDGKRISEEEEIIQTEEQVHVPADVGAIKFFLTNRAPERWQNRVEMEAGIRAEGFEDYLSRAAEGIEDRY